jgi:hypothetical protein
MTESTASEALAFLARIFPGGLRAPALVQELCPEGWPASALFQCFHPSLERRYAEHCRHMEGFESLGGLRGKPRETAARLPTFEEFAAERAGEASEQPTVSAEDEVAELLGLCLWDVFSDNHEVVNAEGRAVSLGSFRSAGGMIAEFFDNPGRIPASSDEAWAIVDSADYMRFYMGTAWVGGRANLTPAYALIFRRLRAVDADWRYRFPRIYLVDFGEREPPSDRPYDPSEAFACEQARRTRADETARQRVNLDRQARAARRAARHSEPPETVRAYAEVFGRFPQGWPPDPYLSDEP